MEALQIYWWFVISLLGGLLVALLFVQGGQTMLWSPGKSQLGTPVVPATGEPERKSLMVNALGRKWELTFTTLVVFGARFSHRSRYIIPQASGAPTGFGCLSC